MEYLLLIYDNEADIAKMSQPEMGAMYQEFMQFTQSIQQSGNYHAGQQLQPVATATTVRVRDGKRLTTDGPFAETREQLGGFYWIKAKDLDEALAIAERCPGARLGSIEVRPIVPPHAG
ncbi:MAG: YciI family protein [Bryobacteraceae bacterium]